MYRGGSPFFYHADGLGSISALTDTTGTPAAGYVYDSFGNTFPVPGSVTNPFRYTAREFDSETGLYYYRARYYDPGVGRFLSEDPIGFVVGSNLYQYVYNNPVMLKDASGLDSSALQRLKDWLLGPPKAKPKPPAPPQRPVNICEKGQIVLFSEAGPNPFYKDGSGEERWLEFKRKFIDKCIAAKKPGKGTVTFCTEGAGILGPFAYCQCCEFCEAKK